MKIKLLIFLIVVAVASTAQPQRGNVRSITPDVCVHGIEPATGPRDYAVFVFCDDGLGTSIGLVLVAQGEVESTAWSLADRFWQEASWARDVTSYVWSPSADKLFVGLSNVYGAGGVAVLDVERRRAFHFDETLKGRTVAILEYNFGERTIKVRVEGDDSVLEKTLSVPP